MSEIMVRFEVVCELFEIITVLQGATVDRGNVMRNISVETTDGYSLYPHTDAHRVFPEIPPSFVCVYLPTYVTNVTLCQMKIQELKQEITLSVIRIILAGLAQELQRSFLMLTLHALEIFSLALFSGDFCVQDTRHSDVCRRFW
jgi:hypothetical protein